MKIRFNYPYKTGKELEYVEDAMNTGRLAGGGLYTNKCQELLQKYLGAAEVLLTHSCTAALEMAAILFNIGPGDEIIMPSYTFVTTANAFVLRGGVPVFVDIRPDTLNIDETKIETAISDKTKAICVVHYAGVSCEMDTIMSIAKKYNLYVLEDAAQALGSEYNGRKLGSIGDLAAISFHETKNIQSGEGGALIINNKKYIERAEIIREKGTDRSKFFKGEVDKYSWVDIGSSYLPSELISAYLYAQLENIDYINSMRSKIWENYRKTVSSLNCDNLTTQVIPDNCSHNAHMFYLILDNHDEQVRFLRFFKKQNISAVFHYIPLHMSNAGRNYCIMPSSLAVTENIYDRIVRLPLWVGLGVDEMKYINAQILCFFE